MKALIKTKPEPGIWADDVPIPEVGPNDVLIRIQKTAICGTDIHIFKWDKWAQKTIHPPLVIGHEFVGVVEKFGENVHDFRIGELVSGEGHVVCGRCRNCLAGRRHLCIEPNCIGVDRNGAFAEYLVIPADNVYRIPAGIPDEIAAIFDPYGNAAHTALSFDLVGEDVLVTGAGPIGAMAVAIARHVGARHVVVTDVNDYRLALAKRMGATRTVHVPRQDLRGAMDELGMTEGFDVGLEMSGSGDAFRQMLEAMNHGARVALLGIMNAPEPIDWGQVVFKGLVLKGIYGREMFETWYKMVAMLQAGLDIAPVITHRLPIDRYAEAFEIARSGRSGKVVLDWGG